MSSHSLLYEMLRNEFSWILPMWALCNLSELFRHRIIKVIKIAAFLILVDIEMEEIRRQDWEFAWRRERSTNDAESFRKRWMDDITVFTPFWQNQDSLTHWLSASILEHPRCLSRFGESSPINNRRLWKCQFSPTLPFSSAWEDVYPTYRCCNVFFLGWSVLSDRPGDRRRSTRCMHDGIISRHLTDICSI